MATTKALPGWLGLWSAPQGGLLGAHTPAGENVSSIFRPGTMAISRGSHSGALADYCSAATQGADVNTLWGMSGLGDGKVVNNPLDRDKWNPPVPSVAKGIAGEVGNLTSEERDAAQISPSFYRKLKRGGTKFLTGRLPEEDVKELRKVTKALRVRTGSNFKDKISNFAKGRQLYADPKSFEEALMAEHGFSKEEKKKEIKKTGNPLVDKYLE